MIVPPELIFDWEEALDDIITALRAYFKSTGAKTGVLGLSGGVDSSLTAYVAARALNPENVKALIMPDKGITPEADVKDAYAVANMLGLETMEVYINPMVDAFVGALPKLFERLDDVNVRIALGNVKARARMVLLYAIANSLGSAQVIGTGDKSEILLGYFTKFGDGGVDVLPLGDLYKTQVRYLASKVGLPERIWMKKPSPRLLPDQLAEEELGLDYEMIDRILYYKVERLFSEEEIAKRLGLPLDLVIKLSKRVATSRHKRKPPPICKIGSATINWDWRMPVE